MAGRGTPTLEVSGLSVTVQTASGTAEAVSDVSFAVDDAQILGIVGESGSGKSLSCLAVMGLLPPGATRTHGSIRLGELELSSLSERQIRTQRGSRIAMVFQDYSEALNPVRTIGSQISEPLQLHLEMSASQARQRGVDLLKLVGIPEPEHRWREYPHQFSGGMAQRAMIAMALACGPQLVIADEPTTALDVTIQAQILELLRTLRDETGAAMIIVSHDLGVIAETADNVAVMYAGRVVEQGSVFDVFDEPRHPYTAALLALQPRFADAATGLVAIDGRVPAITDMPPGCAFAPRCARARDDCRATRPAAVTIGGSSVACLHPLGTDQ